MSALKLITPPAVEPVSLLEAKAHLRVDSYDDDALISGLIIAARQEAEKITRRALITQTWELVLDCFLPEICLPLPSLQSVTTIKYIDTNGTEQTLSNTVYQIDSDSQPARITTAYGQVWPAVRTQMNTVRIRYVAGFGLAVDVPQVIKQWILIRVATLYEQREAVNVGNIVNTIPFVDGLLDEYRVVSF